MAGTSKGGGAGAATAGTRKTIGELPTVYVWNPILKMHEPASPDVAMQVAMGKSLTIESGTTRSVSKPVGETRFYQGPKGIWIERKYELTEYPNRPVGPGASPSAISRTRVPWSRNRTGRLLKDEGGIDRRGAGAIFLALGEQVCTAI